MLATTIQLPNTTPHHQDRATTQTTHLAPVLPQDPIVCRQPCSSKQKKMLLRTQPAPTTGDGLLTAHTFRSEGVFRGAP
jgi:hypothetical protein